MSEFPLINGTDGQGFRTYDICCEITDFSLYYAHISTIFILNKPEQNVTANGKPQTAASPDKLPFDILCETIFWRKHKSWNMKYYLKYVSYNISAIFSDIQIVT